MESLTLARPMMPVEFAVEPALPAWDAMVSWVLAKKWIAVVSAVATTARVVLHAPKHAISAVFAVATELLAEGATESPFPRRSTTFAVFVPETAPPASDATERSFQEKFSMLAESVVVMVLRVTIPRPTTD